MPTNREPKLLTPTHDPVDGYERLKAELEAIRARQRKLEEQYEQQHEASSRSEKSEARTSEAYEDKSPQEKRPKARRPAIKQSATAYARAHPLGFVIILILLGIGLVGCYFLWRYLQSYESTDDAQIAGHLNPVSSRISGTVMRVYVENNQSVVAGQTLIDLDSRDYEVALAQARGNLEQALGQLKAENPNVPITATANATALATAEQDLAFAEAALTAAQHDYDSATADLRQAEANNVQAQDDEARYRQLVAKDEVSREQYDQKLAAANASAAVASARRAAAEAAQKMIAERQAAVAQARSRLNEARQNNPRVLAVRQATIAEREAAVATAQAAVDHAKLQLSYCKIVAPVSGIIGNRTVEAGQLVQPGEQLLVITQTEDLWVNANFKETQIRRMRPSQSVTIHVDALGKDFDGYVENMPGATGAQYSLLPPENATGNFVKVVQRLPVRIRFRKGQPGLERLRPGMSVEPKVWLQ